MIHFQLKKNTLAAFVLGLGLALSMQSQAASRLVIHAAEWGVGKFHRYDNHVHSYGASSWAPFILSDSAKTDQALTIKNTDGSYTVFFSTLDELVESTIQISESEHAPVSVLNVHGHGLPGAMWFPKNTAALNGWSCAQWREAASGSDEDNYGQYYSAVSVNDIESIRSMSNNSNAHTPCTTGLAEWRAAAQSHSKLRSVFSSDAQVHFLSCVVGLGSVGEAFTKGIAELLLSGSTQGRVETSMAFGLGDWSMPEGMGFWDYQSVDQVNRDNEKYVSTKTDREIAQKGSIRLAAYSGNSWGTSQLANRDFMSLAFESQILGDRVVESSKSVQNFTPAPKRVRVPGTNVYLDVTN